MQYAMEGSECGTGKYCQKGECKVGKNDTFDNNFMYILKS